MGNVVEEINQINKEIDVLRQNVSEYESIIQRIEETISNLMISKDYINNTYNLARKNYSSKSANEKTAKIQEIVTEINNMIKKLRDNILPEAKRQITLINSNISSKEAVKNSKLNIR